MIKKLILFITVTGSALGTTLEQFRRYADSVPEAVEIPVYSFLLNPDFSHLYKQNHPSFFKRSLEKIGIFRPSWEPRIFIDLLKSLTTERIRNRLDRSHSVFLKPKPGTRIILIGPLYGSFHSLVRILGELQRKGLLSNELSLTKKDTFLVFQGNIPGGSPYLVETLSLVMALRHANPDRMVYLASEMERNDTWRGYSLKQELFEKIGQNYEERVSQFFNTLAQALFVESPTSVDDVMRIGDQVWCVRPEILPLGKFVI